MRDLYIVSTYYHTLIACIKKMQADKESEILVTDYIPEYESLAQKLSRSGIFANVHSIGDISEYFPKSKLDYIFNHHKRNALHIEDQLGFSMKEYSDIYIFHDDTWFAHYLKCAKISYNLIEDALDSFKTISKSPFDYMRHKADIKAKLKNTFRIGYVYCGYDKYTKSVEVNSIDDIEIQELAGKKLIEVSRAHMFDRLTGNEREILKYVFMKDISPFDAASSILLLTQPLFKDGIVFYETEQIEIYKTLVGQCEKEYSLVIKPHPRDCIDYTEIFPSAVIIDKNMPLEIIGLIEDPCFKIVISFGSTCSRFIRADKYIEILGMPAKA